MSDSKYFTTTKKGEIFELKSELSSDKKEKKREAVKKVIASMTVGKDVSALFPDVVNCMQTDNLELKKLVYLYLMNYAKTQPDLAIMAVNTFVKVNYSITLYYAFCCILTTFIHFFLIRGSHFLLSLLHVDGKSAIANEQHGDVKYAADEQLLVKVKICRWL
ncbi:unnamed protein product [Soboliphyme baturini]|uniref:Adaptin_N domain-containing protein n=1 Tax=Soboliphyme baturini TaxID=241478 RepID=A0A183IVH2_9BILA|nr:unnamed protein product [Soboliphyme baturini]